MAPRTDSAVDPGRASAASPRHRNCFYYFRGPVAKARADRDVDRQIEDNTTKALINVLELSDSSVLESFAKRFVPFPTRRNLGDADFFLQGGPATVRAKRRGLIAISVDGEISSDPDRVSGGSRVDASIETPAWLVVIEVKTAGSLSGAQLLRHAQAWDVPRPKVGEDLPSAWSVITWREVYDWAERARRSRMRERSRFLLEQFVEYLELVGLAPTSRLLPEHLEFFRLTPAERPDELKPEIRARLVTLWELVKDELGPSLRVEVEPTYVGPIKSTDSQAWAQSNRGQRGVNLTLELEGSGLQLNIVAGTADQLEELDAWLDGPGVGRADGVLHDYRLQLFARKPVSRRQDGTPIWRGAQWQPVHSWAIQRIATPAGRREIRRQLSVIENAGTLPAFHIRREWSREAVLREGERLIPVLAREIERLVPILREIRSSRKRSPP